jgi:branched-chain amino acid transport system permease protein
VTANDGGRGVPTITQRVRERISLAQVLVTTGVVAFTVFVAVEFWTPGQEFSFDRFLSFVVVGVTLGSIYGVAASGLVVTYTTSGIFNFAQGAIGMFMAFVYWELKVELGIQTLIAFALTVFVVAPLFGAFIERLLMRRLATATLVAQLVVTIGLMVALMGLAATIWDPNVSRDIGRFFGTDGFRVGDVFVPWYRMITIVAGVAIAISFWVLLYRTRLGVAMRAVVDNRELAALNGSRPGRTSSFAWGLGSALAAMAGIFLAEELSTLGVDTLTLFIVEAFAAAIIGRLRSLPMTLVGGLIIGLALSFQQNFLTLTDRWSLSNQAIPYIILFLALLFLPQARIEGRRLAAAVVPRVPTLKRALLGFVVVFAVVVVFAGILERPDVRRLTLALLVAFAMLSLVPLTGWAGQISLAQITFVGVGAWASLEFVEGNSSSIFGLGLYPPGSPWSLVAAAVVVIPFGLLMALPALRLQGLYLALASMAFAVMAKSLFFDQPEVFGTGGRAAASFEIFGFSFNEPFELLGISFPGDAAMLMLVAALFGVVGFGVVMLRRSAYGRRLVAMRDSPAACATLGVNLLRTKVSVFAIAAAIAGFSGGLLAMYQNSASTANFEMLLGLQYVILAVLGGIAVVSGALLGGILLQSFNWLVLAFPTVEPLKWWQRIGPGLAGIGIGRSPEGIIPTVGHDLRAKRAARQRDTDTRPSDGEPPARSVVPAPAAAAGKATAPTPGA